MPNIAIENETSLKGKLVIALKFDFPGAVVIRHEDHFTGGIPDISMTWRGRTVWLEVKHLNPRMKTKGLQTDTAIRLSEEGYCWFIVYSEKNGIRKTLIVHPREFMRTVDIVPIGITDGFDHHFTGRFLRGFPTENTGVS